MAFTEDLTVFFETNDFAVVATVKNASSVTVRSANVIDNLPQEEVALFDSDARADAHYVLAKWADVSDVRDGWKLVIGGVTYRVTGAAKRVDDGATAIVELRA